MPKAGLWMTATAVCISMCLIGCASDPAAFRDPDGAIRDPETVLIIAHAMMQSLFRAQNPSETFPTLDAWRQSGCAAFMEEGVWVVFCPERGLGGGLTMKLAKNGKLLSVVVRQ